MPTITISLDTVSEEQKRLLVEELTQSAARITNYPADYFFVYIQEYQQENIGVGGRLLKKLRDKQ